MGTMDEHDDSGLSDLDDEDLDSWTQFSQLINKSDYVHLKNQALCRIQYLANTFTEKMAEEGGCKPFHDSIMCWPSTPANTTLSFACPPQIQGIPYMTEYNVTRRCGEDGTWEKANYSGCVAMTHDLDPPVPWIHLRIMYCIYWIGYILSLLFLALALAIFVRYRKLWCLRNIIHSNLILCFALHNVTWIVYSLIANEILTRFYGLEEMTFCYIPTILLKYFIAAGFFWMFVEGVYLFISVIFSFHTRRIRFWMCAAVGWGVPLLLIMVTTIVKSQDNAGHCWNEQYHLDYIFIGPVLCVLLANVAFLLIIMYVVVTKLQVTVPVEATRYKKALKALFILCPLLGVNYIFVLVQPTNPMWAKLIFSYYFTIMTSCQGFLVALLFCFRNNEVWITIGKSLRRWRRGLSSQSILRESGRSDTPTMMVEFDNSSPGRISRHSTHTSLKLKSQRSTEQQTTKLRNVVVMNDHGEFRLFLPQSYLGGTANRNSSPKTTEQWRKRSCPTFRKISSLSWTNGRQMTVDGGQKQVVTKMVRCATSDES